MRKNAIDLVGYIVHFIIEIVVMLALLLSNFYPIMSKSAIAAIGVTPFGLFALYGFASSHKIRHVQPRLNFEGPF